MKALVTGHAGFIGSNLKRRLLYEGWEVNDYLLSDTILNDWMKSCDVVFHLGANTNTSDNDPINHFKDNVIGSIDIFERAIEYKKPVVYTSSLAVFGNTIDEPHGPISNPLNQYAISKLAVDYWIRDNASKFSAINVYRLANVYGKNESMKPECSQSPVYRFMQEAKLNGTVTYYGDFNGERDFVCVEDVVDILFKNPSKLLFDVVGTGTSVSFSNVARMVAEKYDARLNRISAPQGFSEHGYQWYTKANSSFSYSYINLRDWLVFHG